MKLTNNILHPSCNHFKRESCNQSIIIPSEKKSKADNVGVAIGSNLFSPSNTLFYGLKGIAFQMSVIEYIKIISNKIISRRLPRCDD